VPVIVRKSDAKKGSGGTSDSSSASPPESLRREIAPSVFVVVILVVVLIVGFAAYRLFGPGEKWDNSKEGNKPSASLLSAPPPVTRSGAPAGEGKAGAAQEPVGAELPPDRP
jgi:hypothetical protein